ncbi:uncharacterized protein LOC101856093 [Aplysia californica]|uniref:Uncharacterized protein LOC101856093 n=1 Tax=Aplysia californica TaxID=6500 RepID=A0ABM0JL93_APLCA|nr:uncharacterized protein LOC101856093 [Aplysia californica]
MMFSECIKKKRWVVLAVLFGMSFIAVSSYLAYRELYKEKEKNLIVAVYGAFFRTPEEIKKLEEFHSKEDKVPESQEEAVKSCSFTCKATTIPSPTPSLATPAAYVQRQHADYGNQNSSDLITDEYDNFTLSEVGLVAGVREKVQEIPHGCCLSRRVYRSPDTLEDQDGQERRLVHLSHARQYFAQDECRQARGCSGCECRQTWTYHVALVWKEGDHSGNTEDSWDNYELQMVKARGCCKCFNSRSS